MISGWSTRAGINSRALGTRCVSIRILTAIRNAENAQIISLGDASPAETMRVVVHDAPHIGPARVRVIVNGEQPARFQHRQGRLDVAPHARLIMLGIEEDHIETPLQTWHNLADIPLMEYDVVVDLVAAIPLLCLDLVHQIGGGAWAARVFEAWTWGTSQGETRVTSVGS